MNRCDVSTQQGLQAVDPWGARTKGRGLSFVCFAAECIMVKLYFVRE